MVTINSTFFMNGLEQISSAIKTGFKNIASILGLIGGVKNADMAGGVFSKQDRSNRADSVGGTERGSFLDNIQRQSPNQPNNNVDQTHPLPKTQTPLPPLTPDLIDKLVETIEEDRQRAAWFARFEQPKEILTPHRQAPLPPMPTALIDKLAQMIENDKRATAPILFKQ